MKAAFLILLVIVASAHGQEPKAKSPDLLRDALVAPGWSCKYTDKFVVSQGSDKAPKELHPACIARVRCEGGRAWRAFTISCSAKGADTCPSISDCEAEDRAKEVKTAYKFGELSDKADRDSDKDGRKCSYVVPQTKAIHRFVKGAEDVICATAVRCTLPDGVAARRAVVMCQATSTRAAAEGTAATCPRVHECIANEIVPRQGYTAEELAALRASGGVAPKQSAEYSFGDAPFTHPSD